MTLPEPSPWVCPPEQQLLHTDISLGLNSRGWRCSCLPSRLSWGLRALLLLVLVALAGTVLLVGCKGHLLFPAGQESSWWGNGDGGVPVPAPLHSMS